MLIGRYLKRYGSKEGKTMEAVSKALRIAPHQAIRSLGYKPDKPFWPDLESAIAEYAAASDMEKLYIAVEVELHARDLAKGIGNYKGLKDILDRIGHVGHTRNYLCGRIVEVTAEKDLRRMLDIHQLVISRHCFPDVVSRSAKAIFLCVSKGAIAENEEEEREIVIVKSMAEKTIAAENVLALAFRHLAKEIRDVAESPKMDIKEFGQRYSSWFQQPGIASARAEEFLKARTKAPVDFDVFIEAISSSGLYMPDHPLLAVIANNAAALVSAPKK